MINVVLDTNILVAGLRSNKGASFKVLSLLEFERYKIHLSVPLFTEYESILVRELDTMIIPLSEIQKYLNYLCQIASLHSIYYLWRPFLRDPKDDMVLELAVTASCSFIVTFNERDFAGCEQFGIKTIRPYPFLQLLGEVP